MKVLLIVLLAAVSALGAKIRITGGQPAEDGQFPSIVSVRHNSEHNCSGSILDETTILTSALCFLESIPDKIVVGTNLLSSGGDSYAISNIIKHEDFVGTFQNDIALIKLANSIQFNDKVQPIKLHQNDVVGNENCTISGWGFTSYPDGNISDQLNFINMIVMPTIVCETVLQWKIDDNQVCTFTQTGPQSGACIGDHGGPLIDTNGEQIGIASMVYGCADYTSLDVYVRVYSHLDWIETNRY